MSIDIPYWRPLTKPYWNPFTDSISGGVVLCTNLVLYTPLSRASIGPHLRLWTRNVKDIEKLHGIDVYEEENHVMYEKIKTHASLLTHHIHYGAQIWIPHDFVQSWEIGEVRYDYVFDDQLMVNTILVYQQPSTTIPNMIDHEAEFMVYRLARLEDWSETSSGGSNDEGLELELMKLKQEKDQTADRIDFENQVVKFRGGELMEKVSCWLHFF